MYISNMYKYEKDGIVYVAGEVPEGAELLETLDILTAEDGYDLIRIADGENVGNSVWLHNGDVKENYREEEQKENEEDIKKS